MDQELIDRTALTKLLELLGGDPEDLDELIADYLEEAPRLSGRITEAASVGDSDTLRISAHTLKSNARDFGAEALASLCAKLEHACREGNLISADDLAERIRAEEEIARNALRVIDSRDLTNMATD